MVIADSHGIPRTPCYSGLQKTINFKYLIIDFKFIYLLYGNEKKKNCNRIKTNISHKIISVFKVLLNSLNTKINESQPPKRSNF
jgi:hypothetical protein